MNRGVNRIAEGCGWNRECEWEDFQTTGSTGGAGILRLFLNFFPVLPAAGSVGKSGTYFDAAPWRLLPANWSPSSSIALSTSCVSRLTCSPSTTNPMMINI